jgi:hypothetical protein
MGAELIDLFQAEKTRSPSMAVRDAFIGKKKLEDTLSNVLSDVK